MALSTEEVDYGSEHSTQQEATTVLTEESQRIYDLAMKAAIIKSLKKQLVELEENEAAVSCSFAKTYQTVLFPAGRFVILCRGESASTAFV